MSTVAPAFTGPATLKAVFCIVMTGLPELLELPLFELLLHAARAVSASTTARTNARRVRRGRGSFGMLMTTDRPPRSFNAARAEVRALFHPRRCAGSRWS